MTQHLFTSLAQLYEQMDQAWACAADAHGFKCNGCSDNCCTSLFFHHTFVEKAYFLHGFQCLEPEKQNRLILRAETYCSRMLAQQTRARSLKPMCPANEEGLCLLYPFRPMICRLHGLPHELSRPGGRTLHGPGCAAGNFDDTHSIPFDRTPFYQQMAQIELEYRRRFHLNEKIKQTIAQMISSAASRSGDAAIKH